MNKLRKICFFLFIIIIVSFLLMLNNLVVHALVGNIFVFFDVWRKFVIVEERFLLEVVALMMEMLYDVSALI